MRLNPYAVRPEAYKAVQSLSREIAKGTLEHSLRSLVEIRVSQLNACGFCLAMHADGARAAGVPQTKLDTLAGWREDAAFTSRERVALALAETVTHLSGVSNEIWADARAVFTEEEIADLLYLIGLMNLFNRLNVATEFPAELWRDEGLAGLRAGTS
jgi:AhpD family alkylhydroperoxidase